MEKVIKETIDRINKLIEHGTNATEIMQLSQSVLNLTHAAITLKELNK